MANIHKRCTRAAWEGLGRGYQMSIEFMVEH